MRTRRKKSDGPSDPMEPSYTGAGFPEPPGDEGPRAAALAGPYLPNAPRRHGTAPDGLGKARPFTE